MATTSSHQQKSRRVSNYAMLAAVTGSVGLLFAMKSVHPLAGPALPIGALAMIAYVLWGITGPILFTVMLFLRPGELIHPSLGALKLAKLTAIACLGFWFFRFFFLKKRHISRDLISGLMLCFTLAIILCTIKSSRPQLSMNFLIEVWLKIFILFFAIVNLAGHPKAFRAYTTTTISVAVILGIIGVHKGLTAPPSELVLGRVGVGQLLGDPNDYAQLLIATALPYLLNCIIMAPKKRLKVLFLASFLVVSTGIYMTQSRGGFLGFAASTLAVVQPRVSTVKFLAAVGGMGASGVAFLAITKRQSRVGEIDESAQGRLDAWYSATRMLLFNPVFGVGLVAFVPNHLTYAVNPVMWKPLDTHSAWFKIIGELGLLGSIFFFPMILFSLWRAYQLGRWAKQQRLSEKGDWYTEALLRSIFPALVGWCVSGTFLSNCYSWFLYIQIAILIAGLTVQQYYETNAQNSSTDAALPA